MPSLDWISISGFKSIRRLEKLKLGPINVIIGANGSGKSNFISAFSFLNAIRQGNLLETVKRSGGADEILHYGRSETQSLSFHLSFSDETNQYKIELIPTALNGLTPLTEVTYYWDKSEYKGPWNRVIKSGENEAGISQEQRQKVPAYVQKHLEKWRLYHFHDTSKNSPLKNHSDIADNRFLRSDGSNIASFLYLLKMKFPNHYKRIILQIRNVAPFFDDFQLQPLELSPQKISLDWKEKGHDKYMSASAFSDGTLRFIALATLLMQPEFYRPSVILIDEPELGLHPYALAVLASMMKTSSSYSQIIVSTQSAYFLDFFEPHEVLVADRLNGATEFNRLEDEQYADWLEEYSLGQLWEKAELGGRPH